MLLRIGDLWRDQRLVASPSYEAATFDDLYVGRDTVELVKAGLSLDEGVFLLPLSEHPWHEHNTHSYCLRVGLPDGRSIVVPCMELIRFYFGSSTALLSRLFDPPLTKDRLFSNLIFNPKTGWMSINLAEGLPRASASDIARIAGSHTAWRAAVLVVTSCQKATLARQDIYPQAIFPFEGKTNLTVVGKWLSLGGTPQQTFLVYRLESCTHTFPFSALRFFLSGEDRVPQQPKSPARAEEVRSYVARRTEPANAPGLVEQDASSSLKGIDIPVRSIRRFPDLEHKRLIGRRELCSLGATTFTGQVTSAINDLAVGDPDSTRRVRRVMLAEAERSLVPSPPDFLKPVVDAIDRLTEFECILLTASEEDGWTVPIDLLSNDDGVIAEELFIAHNGSHKQRRAAAFGLSRTGENVALVIVETGPLIPLIYPVDLSDFEDPWHVLRCAAQDFIVKIRRPERADLVVDIHDCADSSKKMSEWIQGFWV